MSGHTKGPYHAGTMTMSKSVFSALHDKLGFDIVQRGQDVIAIVWADDDEEQKANARLLAAAPELLIALQHAYTVMKDFNNNWPGRETMQGQALLCAMRDTICAATNQEPQDVQDN